MTDARFARLASLPLRPTAEVPRGVLAPIRRLREVVSHRQLLWLLVRRDVQVRYRNSALGFLWSLIKPIVLFLTYYLVLGQVLGAARNVQNFGIYIFAGLTIYLLFSEGLGASSGSLVNNAGLLKKIYLPREVFPLASIGSACFVFLTQSVVLIGAIVLFQQWPDPGGLFYVIPSIALVLVYVTVFGLVLSVLNVYLRDIQYITEILLTLMMWGSPIVYSWSMAADVFQRFHLPTWLFEAYTDNPLTLAVLGFHRALWAGGTPTDFPPDLLARMVVALAVGVVLLYLAELLFARVQADLAQEL